MTHGLLRTANVGKRGLRWKFRRAEGENSMSESMYPPASLDLARKRRDLAPLIRDAFHAFSQLVFADGALPAKTKQLIAVAAAHITQCPYCIQSHTKAALKHGANRSEEHTSELQSRLHLVCRLLLEK